MRVGWQPFGGYGLPGIGSRRTRSARVLPRAAD